MKTGKKRDLSLTIRIPAIERTFNIQFHDELYHEI